MSLLSRVAAKFRHKDLVSRLQPVFEVNGLLDIADDVFFAVGPICSEVVVAPAAACTIGPRVYVGYGSSISCDRSVRIGAGTRIGAMSVIYDSDFHRAGSHDARDKAAEEVAPKTGPVVIGENVMIGEGVTILKGTTIGDAAVIDAGSVVWGSIGAGERVSGRPRKSTS